MKNVKKIAEKIILATIFDQLISVVDKTKMLKFKEDEIKKILQKVVDDPKTKNIKLPFTTVKSIGSVSEAMEFLDDVKKEPQIGHELEKVRNLMQESLNTAKIIDSVTKLGKKNSN